MSETECALPAVLVRVMVACMSSLIVDDQILDHMSMIENRNESDLEASLRRIVKLSGNLSGVKRDHEKVGLHPAVTHTHTLGSCFTVGVCVQDDRVSKAKASDILTEIFKKIGSKENSREVSAAPTRPGRS